MLYYGSHFCRHIVFQQICCISLRASINCSYAGDINYSRSLPIRACKPSSWYFHHPLRQSIQSLRHRQSDINFSSIHSPARLESCELREQGTLLPTDFDPALSARARLLRFAICHYTVSAPSWELELARAFSDGTVQLSFVEII